MTYTIDDLVKAHALQMEKLISEWPEDWEPGVVPENGGYPAFSGEGLEAMIKGNKDGRYDADIAEGLRLVSEPVFYVTDAK